MLDLEDDVASIDWSQPKEKVGEQVNAAIKGVAAAAVEANKAAAEGRITSAELDRKVQRMADDVKAIQNGMVDMQARAAVDDSKGGDPAPLLQYVGKSGVRLTGTTETVLGAPIKRAGLLDSQTVHGEWHSEFRTRILGLQVAARMAQMQGGDRSYTGNDRGHPGTPLTLERALQLAPVAGAELVGHMQRAPIELRSLREAANRPNLTPTDVQRIFTGGSDAAGGYALPDEVLMPTMEVDAKYAPGMRMSSDIIGSEALSTNRHDQVFLTGNSRPYGYGYAGSDDPAKFTTSSLIVAKRSTQPIALAIRYPADINSLADSIFSSIAALSPIIVRDMMLAKEDMFHNGDTAASHQDAITSWNPNSMWGTTAGAGSSGDHRRLIRGLRARALDSGATVDANGALTRALLTGSLPAAMGVGHADANRRALFTSTPAWLKQITKLEQVSTVDKFGSQATILGVRLGAIDGIVLETSPFISDTMNASGVYDGVTTTKGVVTIANIDRFRWLIRQGVDVRVVYDYERGTVTLVATMRLNLRDVDNGETGTSVKNCALLYNITA